MTRLCHLLGHFAVSHNGIQSDILGYDPRLEREAMRRREFITLMGASVAWPFAAKAQQPGRTYRHGIVAPSPCESAPINIALSDEMRRWGFINGQNLTISCHEFGANKS